MQRVDLRVGPVAPARKHGARSQAALDPPNARMIMPEERRVLVVASESWLENDVKGVVEGEDAEGFAGGVSEGGGCICRRRGVCKSGG